MVSTEVIVSLVDRISDQLSNIGSNAESAFSQVESTAENASSGIDSLESSVNSANETFDNLNGSSLEDVGNAADDANTALENMDSSAENASSTLGSMESTALDSIGNSADNADSSLSGMESAADGASSTIGSIDSTPIKETGTSADGAASGLDGAADAASGLEGVLSAIVGVGIVAAFDEMTSAASDFENSWNSLGLVMGDYSSNISDIQGEWSSTISQIADDTGRSAGTIRSGLTSLGIAGVTSETQLVSSFDAIAGAAYVLESAGVGSLDSVSSAYKRVVSTGTLGNRQLISLGLNSVDVFNATGMSVDELSDKFADLTPNERAAMLDMILNSKYGSEANEAFKNSWSGVITQLQAAMDYITIIAGQLILPILIPAVQAATGALKWMASGINSLPGPIKTVMGVILLLVGVLGTAAAAYVTLSSFSSILAAVQGALTTSTVANTTAVATNTAATSSNATASTTNAAAKSTGVLSMISNTIAAGANTAAQWLNNAALAVQEGTVLSSIGAWVSNTASKLLNTITTSSLTVATLSLASATWALTAALLANPWTWVVIAVIALVAALWYLYNTNESVRNAINWVLDGLKALGGYIGGQLGVAWRNLTNILARVWQVLQDLGNYILGGLMSAWNSITSALSPITTALGKLWTAISKVFGAFANLSGQGEQANGTFKKIADSAGKLWNILSQVAGIIMDALQPHLQVLGQILTTVATIVGDFFGAAWTTISGILGGVIQFIADMINILTGLVDGSLTAGEAMTLFFQMVQKLFNTVFKSIMDGLGQFAIQFVQKGIAAARSFVTGLVGWIASLPGRLWAWLMVTLQRVIAFRTYMIAYARATGMNFLNNIVTFIRQLPGKVWAYLLSTITSLINFAGQAWTQASIAGQNIINAIAEFMVSLPGKMWDWGTKAIQSFVDAIINAIPGLREALSAVSALFPSSPPKEGPLSEIKNENMEKFGAELGASFSRGIDSQTSGILTNLGTTTVSGTAGVAASAAPAASAEGMMASASTGMPKMATMGEDATTAMTGMKETTKTSFETMKNTMKTTLDKMVANNKSGYRDIQSDTKTVLNDLKQETISNTEAVTDSWHTMRDDLITAAKTINTNVSNQVSALSGHVGTFYVNITYPTNFLGPDRYSTPSSTLNVGIVGLAGFGENTATSHSNIRLLDRLSPVCTSPDGCFAGGWDVSDIWIPDTMSKVKGWDVNLSSFNLNKTVGEFTNTSNPSYGNFSDFYNLASKWIGNTGYEYYFDSRYSPYEALSRGAFNCVDGANLMIALANAFGLGGYMDCGMWGNTGHCWAVINGTVMDTTAYQDGYGWTSPKVNYSAGPSPKGGSGSSDRPYIKFEFKDGAFVYYASDGTLREIPEPMKSEIKQMIQEGVSQVFNDPSTGLPK